MLDIMKKSDLAIELDKCRKVYDNWMMDLMKDYEREIDTLFTRCSIYYYEDIDEKDIELLIKNMKKTQKLMNEWFDKNLETMKNFKTE